MSALFAALHRWSSSCCSLSSSESSFVFCPGPKLCVCHNHTKIRAAIPKVVSILGLKPRKHCRPALSTQTWPFVGLESRGQRKHRVLVYSCAGAANTERDTTGVYFLPVLEAGPPRSRCWQVWFLWSLPPCSWLSSSRASHALLRVRACA